MKEQEFDFYRWLAYGTGLFLLSLSSLTVSALIWAFVVLLVIALVDIGYCQYYKYAYKYFSTSKKR